VMHTETNFDQGPKGDEAVTWLRKEWANVLRVRNDGLPIVGFTWYSLTDQVDWDSALREDNGRVNPRGLYDLDRNIRPVGEAYRELIRQWREVLPTQSVVLSVPAFPPSRQDDPLVAALAHHAKRHDGTAARETDGVDVRPTRVETPPPALPGPAGLAPEEPPAD
jgi:beta-glucosidase